MVKVGSEGVRGRESCVIELSKCSMSALSPALRDSFFHDIAEKDYGATVPSAPMPSECCRYAVDCRWWNIVYLLRRKLFGRPLPVAASVANIRFETQIGVTCVIVVAKSWCEVGSTKEQPHHERRSWDTHTPESAGRVFCRMMSALFGAGAPSAR